MIETSNPMVETFTPRMQRASQILANGIVPKEIVNNVWEIPSQTIKGTFYRVENVIPAYWKCECPDFQFRHVNCKHIHAVKFWLRLRKKIYETEILKAIPEQPQPMILRGDTTPQEDAFFCKSCGSDDLIKHGKRKTKNGDKIRFKCKSCGHTFVEIEEGFQNMVYDPKVVTLALDLYFKGTSLRKIEDHLKQFYDAGVRHTTVYNWVRKYSTIINEYVATLDPQVSGVWCADEMTIKAGGNNSWLWHVMDRETRYMLSNLITHKRYAKDARKLFQDAREHANGKPRVMITDGLQSYHRGFNKVFYNKTQDSRHIVSPGLKDPVNNNRVERLHGTIREREKVMRGMQNNETAEAMMKGLKTYYNFVRPHQALNGKTPAEMANLSLGLGNNKWKGLIEKAIEHQKNGAH